MAKRHALLIGLAVTLLTTAARSQSDPLAAEIARWSALLASDTRTDTIWLDAKKSSEPLLVQAEDELRRGRRLLALDRLTAFRHSAAAALYASERPVVERKELAAFEAEWKRIGAVLRDVVSPHSGAPDLAATIRPAFVRALAEASLSQARELYDASLEYGRNTEPQYGLYYLGAAQSHRGFVDIARAWTASSTARSPSLRSLRPEIDALQSDLLAAYHPPAAIDRHAEFIVASAALKEARELDAAGRRHAALLRYLQAAQRVAALRPAVSVAPMDVNRRLAESAGRLDATVDHSVARFFIERAESALAAAATPPNEAVAAAIATDVLPRYFAALEPARPVAPASDPRVTVTLVRWPFT
jgi:hypothetical protein